MKGGIGGIIVGLLLMVGCGHALSASLRNTPSVHDPVQWRPIPTTTIPKRIQEDDSGWNCHTMGNRICGPK